MERLPAVIGDSDSLSLFVLVDLVASALAGKGETNSLKTLITSPAVTLGSLGMSDGYFERG